MYVCPLARPTCLHYTLIGFMRYALRPSIFVRFMCYICAPYYLEMFNLVVCHCFSSAFRPSVCPFQNRVNINGLFKKSVRGRQIKMRSPFKRIPIVGNVSFIHQVCVSSFLYTFQISLRCVLPLPAKQSDIEHSLYPSSLASLALVYILTNCPSLV